MAWGNVPSRRGGARRPRLPRLPQLRRGGRPSFPFPGGDPLAGRRLPYGLTPRDVRLIAALIVALLAAVGLWPAERIAGPARALDGDTLVIAGRTVRLYGIDAPELDQPCRNGRDACGRLAHKHLADLVAYSTVACERRSGDRYGRDIAVCRLQRAGDKDGQASGADLGREMVRAGHAMAYREITSAYVADEPARFAFAPPWDWRERQQGRR